MANSERREAVIWLRIRVKVAVRMMLSMYIRRKVVLSAHCIMNNDMSERKHVKLIEVMKIAKRWYQARGACVRPYSERLSR
jgi:hypothetical protein